MDAISIPFLVVIAIVVLYLLNSIKILREYERGVIFRLGRALPQPKGPGIILVFRPIDQMVRISLRQEVLEVPPQDVITRDNVTIKVNAVVTLYVVAPNDAAIKVANYVYQTSQFAQTTLRSVLGEVELDTLLSHRDQLNLRIQSIIDQRTEPFGVKVTSVEVKQVDLPETMTARHGQAGRGGTRTPLEDHSCRGRIQCRAKAGGCGRAAGDAAHDAAIALSANSDRDRRGEEHDYRIPVAHGTDVVIEQVFGANEAGREAVEKHAVSSWPLANRFFTTVGQPR